MERHAPAASLKRPLGPHSPSPPHCAGTLVIAGLYVDGFSVALLPHFRGLQVLPCRLQTQPTQPQVGHCLRQGPAGSCGPQLRHWSSRARGVSHISCWNGAPLLRGPLPSLSSLLWHFQQHQTAKPGGRGLIIQTGCPPVWEPEGDSCPGRGPPGPLPGFVPRLSVGMSSQLHGELGDTITEPLIISGLSLEGPIGCHSLQRD